MLKNKLLIFIMFFMLAWFLTSCTTTDRITTAPIEKPHLNIARPAPLALDPVVWHIETDKDGKAWFELDQDNFDNLTRDTEKVQDRVYLDENIIIDYKQYYETN